MTIICDNASSARSHLVNRKFLQFVIAATVLVVVDKRDMDVEQRRILLLDRLVEITNEVWSVTLVAQLARIDEVGALANRLVKTTSEQSDRK